MMNKQAKRPKVSDFQPQSPEIFAQLQEEERVKIIKLSEPETPALKISVEDKQILGPVLYDFGKDNYSWKTDSENTKMGELKIFRLINGSSRSRFFANLDEVTRLEFADYIEKINEICKELFQKQIDATAKRVQFDQDNIRSIESEVKNLKQHLSEKKEEENQIAAQKAMPARVFTDAQKAKHIDYQTLPEEDTERSKENLINKTKGLEEKIKDAEKEISKLNNSIEPFKNVIEEFQNKLKQDLSEEDFKNTKLSIEFNQDKIAKIAAKIMPLTVQNFEFYQEITKINEQLQILNCCLNRYKIERNAANWKRRLDRVLFKIEKTIRERDELYKARDGLNVRWQGLTGDKQELCPPLGLKCDSKMFFI